MKALTPDDLLQCFLHGMSEGDVDGVVSLYEPDAVVAADPSKAIKGHTAISSMVSAFLAQRPRFVLDDAEVVQVGDVAIVQAQWTVTTQDAAGETVPMNVTPTLVIRRQADGRWLVVIDRPRSAA
jgi:uncharacterized protein (TIGR02246 family)